MARAGVTPFGLPARSGGRETARLVVRKVQGRDLASFKTIVKKAYSQKQGKRFPLQSEVSELEDIAHELVILGA